MPRYSKYSIQSGDTLSKIAEQRGFSLIAIERANPNINPNLIRVGQVINIPEKSTNNSEQRQTENTLSSTPKNIGYWDWNWHPKPLPAGTNMSLIFSGFSDTDTVLNHAKRIYNRVAGNKYLCFGGGGASGAFHASDLTNINTAIKAKKLSGYQGIAYDVEVGTSGLASAFSDSFALAKEHGLKVVVTVSHSAPYNIPDKATLMSTFFENENIDFLSPQLYDTGKESQNVYDYSEVKWSEFANAKAVIIPSIVKGSYFADAVAYFENIGVDLEGYIQWW